MDLSVEYAENSIVFPCCFEKNRAFSGIYNRGEVMEYSLLKRAYLDKNQASIVFSLQENPQLLQSQLQAFSSAEDRIEETCIFAGYLIGHYGHFLLESLSRLWYIKEQPEIPIVWVRYLQGANSMKKWQDEIFSLLQIPNRQIILDKPTCFRKIIVPSPGCVIRNFFHEKQAKSLNVSISVDTVKDSKTWISRSQLRTGFVVENESLLEKILETQGWNIFHPQKCSVKEQLEKMLSSERIAGFQGSAFHTAVLFPDNTKTKIQILKKPDQDSMKIYQEIAKKKKIQQLEYSVNYTHTGFQNKHQPYASFLLNSYKEALELIG